MMINSQNKLKVCFLGNYQRGYPGNSVLIQGLKLNNVKVIECRYNVWKDIKMGRTETYKSIFSKILLLIHYVFGIIVFSIKYMFVESHDIIIVGFPIYFDIFIIKLLALIRKKKVIVSPMFSLYDTIILDRKIFSSTSIMSKLIKSFDKILVDLSDIIFLDNKEHIRIWVNQIKCNPKKIRQLCLGVDDKIFHPGKGVKKKDTKHFHVLFYGTFLPSQGIPNIIKAAKILEKQNVLFIIIGYGSVAEKISLLTKKLKIKNIKFIRWVEFENLPNFLAEADVCLGMFGTTPKTRRCFANKVVQAMACKKAIITGDTPASREFLKNKESVIFCKPGDPDALADSILLLKRNQKLRQKIANNAFNIFKNGFSPYAIGKKAKQYIEKLINN